MSQPDFEVVPKNIAARTGTRITLNCTVTYPGDTEWNEYISGSENRIYYKGTPTSPAHPNAANYGINYESLGSNKYEYDLIIHSLSKADAGQYVCNTRGMFPYFRYAQVIQVGT